MLKKWILRIIAGLGFFITALLITAPADIMILLVSNVPGLQLQSVSGRFFSGQAQQIHYHGKSFKQLSWELSLLSLFKGKAGIDLELIDPVFTGHLQLEKGLTDTYSVSEVNARQPVDILSGYWPVLHNIKPAGKLVWHEVSVSFNEKLFEAASGAIQWTDATLSINHQELTLGTINMELSTENGELVVTISDENSVLDLQGNIHFAMDKNYRLELNLSTNLPDQIKNAVQMVTQPDGQGRLIFKTTGRL